jgi:hypothetical protein
MLASAVFVMAGLDPAIHDFLRFGEDVGARVKPGHDDAGGEVSGSQRL